LPTPTDHLVFVVALGLGMKTILVLSANPEGTDVLDLGREVLDIRKSLDRSKLQAEFKLEHRSAVEWKDFRRAIEDLQPEIVHFSGHGTGKKGILVLDEDGQSRAVTADALMRMFKQFPSVECVVLNACYSEEQAIEIHRHVPYVVGMSLAIGDRAAREFAEAFYDGLFAGRGYRDAYEMGLSGMANDVEVWTPVLKERKVKESEKPAVEVLLTRSQKSNLRELARLEQDLAAVEEDLDVVQEGMRKRRLREQKSQLLADIEKLS
jgi:CHAT domain